MLANQKNDWLAFLREIGYPPNERKLDWKLPAGGLVPSVPLINMATLTRADDSGEMRCFNYSTGDAAALGKEFVGNAIIGQGIALLRFHADLLRHLLLALFDANDLV
jgi:hypothetical protein